jgi:hypothetical protein
MTDCSRDTERAMSQENVEIVRRGIDAWNRADLDDWLAAFTPEASGARCRTRSRSGLS